MKFYICQTLVFVFGFVVKLVGSGFVLIETIMGFYIVKVTILRKLKETSFSIFWLSFVISGVTDVLEP